MNKEEFLTQLKKNISVLDDKEQAFFVEEYTQHIDMKMGQGMSEEEALREIGSVEELSKEILESYHVKPDLNRDEREKGLDAAKLADGIKAKANKLQGALSAIWKGIGSFFAGMQRTAKKLWNRLFPKYAGEKSEEAKAREDQELAPETWREQPAGAKTGAGGISADKGIRRRRHGLVGMIGTFFSFCGRVIRACVGAMLWLMRKCIYLMIWAAVLCWNCFMIGAGIIGSFALMMGVFVLGVLLVMTAQGYPVVGMLIAVAGGCAAVGAAAAACFMLVVGKVKDGDDRKDSGRRNNDRENEDRDENRNDEDQAEDTQKKGGEEAYA